MKTPAAPLFDLVGKTALVTGCRRGELCAVRWSDVDLDRNKIALERSVPRSNQSPTGLQEKRPKGDKEAIADGTYPVGSSLPMNEDIRGEVQGCHRHSQPRSPSAA